MMNCIEVRGLLPACVDQELSVAELQNVDRHLQTCADCRSEHAAQRDLSARVKSQASYFEAPAHLAARIRASTLGETPQSTTAGSAGRKNFRWRWGWPDLRTGMVMASLLVASWSVSLHFMQPSEQDRLVDEIVASHVRALQVDHLSDVISTDQHTVKPWFNGKLDFAPPVTDLAAQGFPLTGGRLDYLGGRAVAALIYRVGQHPIDLYVWPAQGSAASEGVSAVQTRQGYHLAHWSSGGMHFWAASDGAASEVEQFAHLMAAATR